MAVAHIKIQAVCVEKDRSCLNNTAKMQFVFRRQLSDHLRYPTHWSGDYGQYAQFHDVASKLHQLLFLSKSILARSRLLSQSSPVPRFAIATGSLPD